MDFSPQDATTFVRKDLGPTIQTVRAPQHSPKPLPQMTFVFCDLTASTHHRYVYGEQRAYGRVAAHNRAIADTFERFLSHLAERHDGAVNKLSIADILKFVGDGALVQFREPVYAVEFSVLLQSIFRTLRDDEESTYLKGLREHGTSDYGPDDLIRTKVAVTTGTAIPYSVQAGGAGIGAKDFLSSQLDLAARLLRETPSDCILITEEVRSAIFQVATAGTGEYAWDTKSSTITALSPARNPGVPPSTLFRIERPVLKTLRDFGSGEYSLVDWTPYYRLMTDVEDSATLETRVLGHEPAGIDHDLRIRYADHRAHAVSASHTVRRAFVRATIKPEGDVRLQTRFGPIHVSSRRGQVDESKIHVSSGCGYLRYFRMETSGVAFTPGHAEDLRSESGGQPFEFHWSISPPVTFANDDVSISHDALCLNAYALSAQEYRNMYGRPPQPHIGVNREILSIDLPRDHPIEELTSVVEFPVGLKLDSLDPEIVAFDPEGHLSTAESSYCNKLVKSEVHSNSVPERLRNAPCYYLRLPYPKAGYRYCITWGLPERVDWGPLPRVEIESENTEACRKALLKAFDVKNCRPRRRTGAGKAIERFLSSFESAFRKRTDISKEERIEIGLAVFDRDKRRLRFIGGNFDRSDDRDIYRKLVLQFGEGVIGRTLRLGRIIAYRRRQAKLAPELDVYVHRGLRDRPCVVGIPLYLPSLNGRNGGIGNDVAANDAPEVVPIAVVSVASLSEDSRIMRAADGRVVEQIGKDLVGEIKKLGESLIGGVRGPSSKTKRARRKQA